MRKGRKLAAKWRGAKDPWRIVIKLGGIASYPTWDVRVRTHLPNIDFHGVGILQPDQLFTRGCAR